MRGGAGLLQVQLPPPVSRPESPRRPAAEPPEVDLLKLITKPIERGFFAVIDPAIQALIRSRISPNVITTVGTLVVIASAVGYGSGWVHLGGFLYLLSGVVDTLDGAVARGRSQTTRFGAFFDSTLDRLGDGATYTGIAVLYLLAPEGTLAHRELAIILCMVAIIAALMVSYARARAEGLGVDCKVGLVQRAERIVGLGVPTLIWGAGPQGLLLLAIVGILALGSIITVIQRFVYVYQVTEGAQSSETPKGP
jgi:CDP-diacylglycerol--glycerol-3-phosphate 3-phosphatidyltransferase